MLLTRLVLLALLVASACLTRVAADIVAEIDNNEVLPENDVARARVNEVPASVPSTSSTPPEPVPSSTSGPSTEQEAKDAPTGAPPTTTSAPRPPSTLSRFLSDIIQIPIAVLRSVGSLLSNTFSGHRGAGASGPVGDTSAHA